VVSGANYVLELKIASTTVVYIKQTEYSFFGGFKEHTCVSYVEWRRENLNYTKHILEMGHKYGPLQEVWTSCKCKKKDQLWMSGTACTVCSKSFWTECATYL